MIGKFSIIFCLVTLTAYAVADEPRTKDQRLDELERRVTQLEDLINPAKGSSSMAMPSGSYGRFVNTATQRKIDLKTDGTFSLQTPSGLFSGTWQKTGDQIVLRATSGLTETFRVTGDGLVDSQGQRWITAKAL